VQEEGGFAVSGQDVEERYRALLDAVPSMTFEGDAEGGNTFASEQWCAYTGMTAEQTAGFGWAQAVHPEDLPSAAARWAEAMRQCAPCEMRHRIRAADGSYRWFLLRARPLRDAEGRIKRWVGSLTDIDDLQQAEQALRESERRYRELVENANSVIIRWRRDGTLTFFNEYAERFFGYRADEVLGRHVGLLVPDRDSEGADLSRLVEDIASHPERYVNNINENICRDGRRAWMSWTNRAIRDEHGQVIEILAIASDITERIRAEKALRESEERFQLASEIGRSGTWDWNVATGEVVWSRGHFEILGYRLDEVRPSYTAWADRVHPDDLPGVEAEIRRTMAERADYACDFRVVWPDRSVHWMSARARYEYGTDGACCRMIGVMADVTELKEAERRLRELNGELAALLAERSRLADEQAAELRELATGLTQAEQRERDLLYELLHDHVQPLLVGARLRLSGLERRTPIEAWLTNASEVRKQIGEALDMARSLSVVLNPPLVREQGLGAALDWLCRWLKQSQGLDVRMACDPSAEPVDVATRLLLFKATRELLMNVAKHAGVREVTLAMERTAGPCVQITVSDRGTGFDVRGEAWGRRSGSGLWDIERRFGMIGGGIAIDSAPRVGTTVRLTAPLVIARRPQRPRRRAASNQ
jgi:PAS domain S-box-containing protein